MKHIVRTIHPETRILDEKTGLCEYIASDETLDHYREIIRADGWRFSHFAKNAPFVDSHDYSTIEKLLGSVVDFRVEGRKLIETVQWEPEANPLAKIGWAMTVAGHLRAVSVGFLPTRAVTKWDNGGMDLARVASEMGLTPETSARVATIYLEQEQIELSACIIGANPAALARAYKAGAIGDGDLDLLATKISEDNAETARSADQRAAAERKWEQRERWLGKIEQTIKTIK
jgi:hypothetical protein